VLKDFAHQERIRVTITVDNNKNVYNAQEKNDNLGTPLLPMGPMNCHGGEK
jgi:hypothetical protein